MLTEADKFRQSSSTSDTSAHVVDLVNLHHYAEYTTPPSGFLTLMATKRQMIRIGTVRYAEGL